MRAIIAIWMFMTLSTPALADTTKAYLAGGCFWCMESEFQGKPGVVDVVSGYTDEGVEAVEITYDAAQISFAKILDVYWQNIDPFDGKGQFYDRGKKYEPAIFVANDAERKVAEESKAAIEKKFGKVSPVKIEAPKGFKRASEDHQDFYMKNPDHYNRYKKGSGREDLKQQLWGK